MQELICMQKNPHQFTNIRNDFSYPSIFFWHVLKQKFKFHVNNEFIYKHLVEMKLSVCKPIFYVFFLICN